MSDDTPKTPGPAPATDPAPMTLAEALDLLGVDALPGLDGASGQEFLESMARMRQDEGEAWIRDNREDLVALWAAMLAAPPLDDPS